MLSHFLQLILCLSIAQSADSSPSPPEDPSTVSSFAGPGTPSHALLAATASSSATYKCDENTPCSNGACCGTVGYCGYGPTYCGTTGTSPNADCWSNCDAFAECGRYAAPTRTECPLNVCCSEFGFCGTTPDFCSTGCQSNCNQPESGASNSNSQQRIMAYYESWSNGKQCMGMNINQIPVQSLTHLNYAFGYIAPDTYQVLVYEWQIFGTSLTFTDWTDAWGRSFYADRFHEPQTAQPKCYSGYIAWRLVVQR